MKGSRDLALCRPSTACCPAFTCAPRARIVRRFVKMFSYAYLQCCVGMCVQAGLCSIVPISDQTHNPCRACTAVTARYTTLQMRIVDVGGEGMYDAAGDKIFIYPTFTNSLECIYFPPRLLVRPTVFTLHKKCILCFLTRVSVTSSFQKCCLVLQFQ